ncbi:MAG: group II intron reverse transcriptase/maturase, partial [Prevotella sp.]|nr:group II intron reverse transcriptase/maturase [Prevotella sp.]
AKCASSAEPRAWTRDELDRARKWVGKLQRRIAKAQREKRYNKAKALQRLLVTSRAAKITAVERVTSNKGKRTAGVDGVTWQTNAVKAKAIGTLRRRGYKPKPLKRVYIPKKNGKKRPLGIPTMKDRAMQALYQVALEPIAETTADKNSYGFRKYRGCQDAIDALHRWLSRKESPEWVLEGDIKGCFDHISHEWLVRNVRTDSEILRKWLTSGVIYNRLLTPTTEGTPQGGIISPTLANITLDGMERLVKSRYPSSRPKGTKGKWQTKKVNLVRYADDFIVTAADKETLLEVKAMLTAFLAERGLELSEEKTLITHITEGFDFLGFNIRKYNGKLIIKPSKKSQERFVEKLHETIFRWNKTATQEALIDMLNPILRGWANYNRHVCSTGALLYEKEVPLCWITHVQFNPADPELIMFNHEWPSFDCGIRRIWLHDHRSDTIVRIRKEGADTSGNTGGHERRGADWICHEMWTDDGGTIIYHGGYADGPALVGKYELASQRYWEIALPEDYNAYGHFTMDHQQNLCCDGYFKFPDDIKAIRENSTDNGPDPHKKDGEYISRVVPHWEKGRLEWIPLCKHSSDWLGQDAHPHRIYSHAGNTVFFNSRSGRYVKVYKVSVSK